MFQVFKTALWAAAAAVLFVGSSVRAADPVKVSGTGV